MDLKYLNEILVQEKFMKNIIKFISNYIQKKLPYKNLLEIKK